MEYKTNRNLKIRVADPIGYALMIAGIPFIAVKEAPPFDFVPNLMVSYAIGLGLVMLGAYRASLVTTDLSCNTCTGVILESKSIDQKLKGDGFGLALNKAEYIRTALSSSIGGSVHDCPDCGEKMSSVEIPIEVHVSIEPDESILIPDAIERQLSTVSKIVELDGCKECDLLWFKNTKKEQLLSGDHTIIPKSASKAEFEYH